MRLRVLRFSFLIILAVLGLGAQAETPAFEVSGSARVRGESKDNGDFNKTTLDYKNYTGSRFRVGLKFNPNSDVSVFFQPQFSKIWGTDEVILDPVSGAVPGQTSGQLNDTGVDVHQAYMSFSTNGTFSMTLGRRELSFGDELLVGAEEWSNTGRAFDVASANFKWNNGAVDLFASKLRESNSAFGTPADADFSGLYWSNQLRGAIQNVDAYVLYKEDKSEIPTIAAFAYGLRLQSVVNSFDYRVEGTWEKVHFDNQVSGERQWDGELGFTTHPDKKFRFSVGYFEASENFDELYPSRHKWLGVADQFSRQNITGYRAGFSAAFSDEFNMVFSYHDFSRTSVTSDAIRADGYSYGSLGSQKPIASEMDLVAKYRLASRVDLELGAARVEPKKYLKDNGQSDVASFYYLQIGTVF